jgi:hypothetical protein
MLRKLQEEIHEKENKLETSEKLSKEYHIQVNDLNEEVKELKQIIHVLKNDNSKEEKLLNALNHKRKEIEYIKSRALKMLQKKKQLEITVKTQRAKMKKLEEFKAMAQKKFGSNIKDLEQQIASYKQEIEEERSRNLEILNTITNINQDQNIVNDLLDEQQNMANDEIVADEESVGELFEINNEAMWQIKVDNIIDGPYSFLDIKDMLEKREISSTASLKKPGSPWKNISDIFEFNTEILTKTEDGDTKLYIKRDDMRVPIFEDVTLVIENEEFNGKCTNLSNGGCFIESTALSNKIFIVGKEVEIIFTGDGPHQNLKITSEIRSITDSIPPGAGFQFTQIDEEQHTKLDHFFHKFLRHLEKKPLNYTLTNTKYSVLPVFPFTGDSITSLT